MSERFELTLSSSLAGLFREHVRAALEAAGFVETLELASPHVSQYQRDGDLISLEVEHTSGHKEAIALESESLNLDPFVGRAALLTMVEVCDQLLASLPWVDQSAARREVEALLSRLLAPQSGSQDRA